MVADIDAATTREDWLEVRDKVRSNLHLLSEGDVPHRRTTDSLLLRDLGFWTEISASKTAKEILKKWDEKHPEDENWFGEEAVRKGARRIDKIVHHRTIKRGKKADSDEVI